MSGAYRYWTGADCVRHWQWFPKVGPAEIVRNVAPACVRAGALALPLALPGAAFLQPAPYGGVTFGGPAYAPYAAGYGSVLAPGLYEVPALAALPVQVGQTYPYAGGLQPLGGNAAVGESPTLTPMLSGDVPHFLPDRDVPGQSVPTEVPEASSLAVLAAALIAMIFVRKRA